MKNSNKIPEDLHKIAVFYVTPQKEIGKSYILPVSMLCAFLYLILIFTEIDIIDKILISLIVITLGFYYLASRTSLFSQFINTPHDTIICYEEGILFRGGMIFNSQLNFLTWGEIIEISLSKDFSPFLKISFMARGNFSDFFNLSYLKAKYIYPKEVYKEESLAKGVNKDLMDNDALNLLWICLRRAYNANWTGDIKPSDIFGKEWQKEIKEE